MNATVTDLEALGLRLGILPDGRLSIHGLEVLDPDTAARALALAREHKPALLRELAQLAGIRLCANCGKPLRPSAGPHVSCCCGSCFSGAGREWRGNRLVHRETGWWQ